MYIYIYVSGISIPRRVSFYAGRARSVPSAPAADSAADSAAAHNGAVTGAISPGWARRRRVPRGREVGSTKMGTEF